MSFEEVLDQAIDMLRRRGRSPMMERHFRDVQVLRYYGLAATTRYETVGQIYLGVFPQTSQCSPSKSLA